jgi:hypothetical protein
MATEMPKFVDADASTTITFDMREVGATPGV